MGESSESKMVEIGEPEYWEKAHHSLTEMAAVNAPEGSLENALSAEEREKLARKLEKYKKLAEKKQQAEETIEPSEVDDLFGISTPASLQGKYLFVREIGRGAQARVYLALRLSDQKNVAIKQLNIGSVKNWKEYELFGRESKVLESLEIEGVARFYEAVECLEDNPPCSYLVQEFIDGASVATMFKSGHRFKVSDVYDIIVQMLQILKRLQSHDPPVIHRDIKPSNLMISPNPDGSYRVTLIDFGAVANPQVQGGGSTLAGTFGYMPPEQLMGKPLPASDVYAVAAVAVQLFCGKSPADLPMKDFRVIFEPEMEQMPPALIHTLRKMLEPKIDDRLSDIDELIGIFEQFKKENYRISTIDAEVSKDLNDKLCQVRAIGENGNMDLWQKLPDESPRPIPEVLIKDHVFLSPYADELSLGRIRDFKYLIAGLMILAVDAVLFQFIKLDPSVHTILMMCLVMGVIFILKFVIGKKPATMNTYFDLSEDGDLSLDDAGDKIARKPVPYDLYRRILRDGRKTVATIKSVRYCRLGSHEVQTLDNVNLSDDMIGAHPIVCLRRPLFKIRYTFNPPDDAKDEDLLHECLVRTEPERHYAVGDPLPIIYLLDNGYFSQNVYSIPFPFPMGESRIEELVCMEDVKIKKKTPVEKTDDYRNFLLPIMKESNDRLETIRALECIPYISDVRVCRLLIGTVVKIIQSQDHEISSLTVNMLCESIRRNTTYKRIDKFKDSNEVASTGEIAQLYTDFLYHFFMQKPRKVTYGAMNGVISYHYPLKLPVKIFEACVDVYMDEKVDPDILYIVKNGTKAYSKYSENLDSARFPMSVVHYFFRNPNYEPYIPFLFGVWDSIFTHGLRDSYQAELEEFLRAWVDYSDWAYEEGNNVMQGMVFEEMWHAVYLLEFPEWFWPELVRIYDRSSKGLKWQMTDCINTNYYLLMPIDVKRHLNIRVD